MFNKENKYEIAKEEFLKEPIGSVFMFECDGKFYTIEMKISKNKTIVVGVFDYFESWLGSELTYKKDYTFDYPNIRRKDLDRYFK